MRDYAKIGPKFWIGGTGKALRKAGIEAQLVALYLLTSPHANMLGLYYIPVEYIKHETGMTLEGASKGLQSCVETGFCEYDSASETVWVVEMARFQIADTLKATDLRVKGIQNEYESLPINPFLSRFYDRYAGAFCMSSRRGSAVSTVHTFEAPSKPLRSQEQEQEQEQEVKALVASDADDQIPAHTAEKPSKPDCPHQQIVELYHEILPQCPRIRDWTPARQQHLRARWNEDAQRQNLEYWRRFFEYVATCDFLVGRSGKTPFLADLEWMVTSKNFTKIREEKYANRSAA